MTIEEFRNLKENDIIVLNEQPIEKHKDVQVVGFGAMLSCIEDLRNKTIKGTKFQVDNCSEVYKNCFYGYVLYRRNFFRKHLQQAVCLHSR